MSGSRLVLVVTGPSGAGKSTVIFDLLRLEPGLRFSVSHTTRSPRPGERSGIDYWFVDRAAFDSIREGGGFLEWATVHGELYGTSLAEIERPRDPEGGLLLDIDVQGAAQVQARLPDAVSVFLLPPDYTTLEARLRARGSEREDAIRRRLEAASAEVRRCREFGYLVVNKDLGQAVGDVRKILGGERLRTDRRWAEAERILASFPPAREGP
jgi:guanylate kinase